MGKVRFEFHYGSIAPDMVLPYSYEWRRREDIRKMYHLGIIEAFNFDLEDHTVRLDVNDVEIFINSWDKVEFPFLPVKQIIIDFCDFKFNLSKLDYQFGRILTANYDSRILLLEFANALEEIIDNLKLVKYLNLPGIKELKNEIGLFIQERMVHLNNYAQSSFEDQESEFRNAYSSISYVGERLRNLIENAIPLENQVVSQTYPI